jgi:hypothetical protein
MLTPEQLAEDYGATVERVPIFFYKPEEPCKNAYLAGYQAAKDHYFQMIQDLQQTVVELKQELKETK